MEKKILIATVALSLVAVAIVIIANTNRSDNINENSSFVGKIQNETALETIPTQSLAPQTGDLIQDAVSELVNIDTNPITIMPHDTQLSKDVNATKTEIVTSEQSSAQDDAKNNQTSINDTFTVTPIATKDVTVETKINEPKQNPDLIVAPNSDSTLDTVNLAATKPPLESLLFKSGDDNLPVSVPNIPAKEEKTDLSANKFEEVQTTVKPVEIKKTVESEAPKVEAAVTDKSQTPEIAEPTEATKAEVVKTEATKIESEKAKVLVTSTKLKANGQDPTILATKLEMNGDVVSLRLEGNQALSAKSYILNNPERVVFDLSGKWEISVPRVISNRMVKSIRLGEQAGGTRIVFDMLVPAKKSDVKKVDANTLELNIR